MCASAGGGLPLNAKLSATGNKCLSVSGNGCLCGVAVACGLCSSQIGGSVTATISGVTHAYTAFPFSPNGTFTLPQAVLECRYLIKYEQGITGQPSYRLLQVQFDISVTSLPNIFFFGQVLMQQGAASSHVANFRNTYTADGNDQIDCAGLLPEDIAFEQNIGGNVDGSSAVFNVS